MRQRPLATVCIGVTALLAALFFPADYTTAASGGAGGPPAPRPSSPTGGLPTADTQAPTVPAGLTTTPINSNQVDLAWSASTDDVGVTAYKVYRSGALLATLGNVTSYSNSGLTASTTYSYTVSACDAAGNCSSQSSSASATTQSAADTQPPTAPTGLTATSTSAGQIDLSWTYSIDNVGVTAYKVYRSGALLATLGNVTSYSNSGLTGLTTYSYTVSACDAAGNCSSQSSSASATTQSAADTQPPTAPTGLTATSTSAGQIDLSWTYSIDNVGVTAYKVYRSGALLATLGNVTSYSNSGLTGLTTYSYTVSACDAAGNCSASSAPVSVATQAQTIPAIRVAPTLTGTPTGPITDQTITVSVTPPANVLNLTASLFVAAVLPPSLDGAIYVMSSDRGWTAYTECSAAPTAQVGPLSSGLQISLLPSPTDLSPLRGTVIYVGYGFGTSAGAACTDMLDSSTIAPAYTIN